MVPAGSSQHLLSRLPHEIRLSIFRHVFDIPWGPETIRVEDTVEGVKFKCPQRKCGSVAGGISCLNATTYGEGVAAAAAEQFYRAGHCLGVDAKDLCTFLQHCPLSGINQPGRYITSLSLYMDEDPNYIGDGTDGQALRKADWVDLESWAGDDRTTRSGKRTQLMRQCWRAILNMPKLRYFEFCIMPSRGRICAKDIYEWEIRDIIPMHLRLTCKAIHPSICLRTWEIYDPSEWEVWWNPFGDPPDVDDEGLYESNQDISCCVPRRSYEATDDDRAEAASISDPRTVSERCKRERIVNHDALQEFIGRLKADKKYKFTIQGKVKRKRKRESDGSISDKGGQRKRRC